MSKNQFLPPKVRRPREELKLAVQQIEGNGYIVAGSWRREKETVGDLDVIVPPALDLDTARAEFGTFFGYEEIRGGLQKSEGIAKYQGSPLLLNLWNCGSPMGFPAMLLYTTGPYDLNIAMRANAKGKGWLLNEKGLFSADGVQLDDGTGEEDIFRILGIQYLTPAQRENWRDHLIKTKKKSGVGVMSSNGTDVYMVEIEDGKAVSCECKGFTYRHHCRHLAEAEAKFRKGGS